MWGWRGGWRGAGGMGLCPVLRLVWVRVWAKWEVEVEGEGEARGWRGGGEGGGVCEQEGADVIVSEFFGGG